MKLDDSVVSGDQDGHYDHVKYIIGHPEQFVSKKAFNFLKTNHWQSRITNIVVDEAHCVSQWGEGFRSAFQDIIKLRSLFPKAKILALTATATIKMQNEITSLLGMKTFKIIQGNVDRSNIKIEVVKRPAGCGGKSSVEDSYDFILDPLMNELVSKADMFPKTVVYSKLKWCGYGYEKGHRLSTDENDIKRCIAQNHSPCTQDMRNKVLSSMTDPNGDTKLLFVTEAYSMGTDASDIRRVVHAGVPPRLETYIQEIGRAGRDGMQAIATLYYNKSDLSSSSKGMTEEMKNFCLLDTCRRDFLCQHFGHTNGVGSFTYKHDCCDNCEKLCKCEKCTESSLLTICETVESEELQKYKLTRSKDSMKQLECVLMEYFNAENEIVGVPNGEIVTGLSKSFAKEISMNSITYLDVDQIIEKHETLAHNLASNIALLVSEIVKSPLK